MLDVLISFISRSLEDNMAKFIKSKFKVLWGTIFSFFYGFFATDLLAQDANNDGGSGEEESSQDSDNTNLDPGAIAAAVAAVLDVDYTRDCLVENLKNREWLSRELKDLGLKMTDSKANFLLVDFNSENQANKVFSFLKNQNIYVRKVTDYGLSKSIRISVGTNDECKLVKKNVQKFLELDNGL